MNRREPSGALAERQRMTDRLDALNLEIMGVRSMLDVQFRRITSPAEVDLLPLVQGPATAVRRRRKPGTRTGV